MFGYHITNRNINYIILEVKYLKKIVLLILIAYYHFLDILYKITIAQRTYKVYLIV